MIFLDATPASLLLRPLIMQNESLSGYLFRLCRENNYSSISGLINRLGLSIYESQNNEFSEKAVEELAELVRGRVERFEKNNGYYNQSILGTELYKKIVLRNKVKYCPVCLVEGYYHRTIWNFTSIHLCNQHNVSLVDRCPRCGSAISMSQFISQECKVCSSQYKSVIAEPIESLIFIESQNLMIQSLLDPPNNVIGNCNFSQFFRLALHSLHLINGADDYTGMSNGKLSFFHNCLDGVKSGFKLALALANVYWMYLEFPERFYNILGDFLQRNKGSHRLYERLQAFESIFNSEEFDWVQEAYNDYFIKQLDEGRVRKDFSVFKNNPNLLELRNKVRREEVRKNTGIAYDKLHEVEELQIETILANGRQRYLVEKKSLDNYLNIRQSQITKKEVGLILGVTPDSVQKIINAGYLTPIRSTSSPIAVYQIQEVNIFMEECLGKLVDEVDPAMLRFHNVLSRYAKYAFTILEIVAFTLGDQLKPLRSKLNSTIADNYYWESEIRKCLDILNHRRKEETGFYFSDVMKILKIGEKRLWRILTEHGIEPDYTLIMKDGRKRDYFNKTTISKISAYLVAIESSSVK